MDDFKQGDDEKRDDVLKRMLKTPPAPHEPKLNREVDTRKAPARKPRPKT